MNLPKHLQDAVEQRAASRCEYCRMHQALQGATFHVEHVQPRSRAGQTRLENLAWACPGCNLRKADRVDALDADTGLQAELFNPRTQDWPEHFRWDGHRVVALTATGRVTVAALELNHPRRILIRQAEKLFSLFPPDEA